MRIAFNLVWLAAVPFGPAVAASPIELRSPDGQFVVIFETSDFGAERGCPSYRIAHRGHPIMMASRLGLELAEGSFTRDLAIVGQSTSRHDSTWQPVWGERSEIRDRFNQVVVTLKELAAPQRTLEVTFRAYDEGVAFCYTLPRQPGFQKVRIKREVTEFRLSGDYPVWATYAGQGAYQQVPIQRIKSGCERPLVVEMAANRYAAIAEAKLVDYARMKFAPLGGVANGLIAKLDSEVTGALPLTTPWRLIMAADSPGRLLENNFIVLNLNDPCALADTSWIKPGKVIREVTLTTAGGRACVDFAVKRGLQYVEYDAGWYGHEYDAKSDATTVTLDPRRSKGPLDLPDVIRYAEERGIGILVYVNHLALEKQIDELLPLYRQWGIKGIKFGFVNVGSQQWTAWLHEAIRKCATHGFMVDVHDEYRPSGYRRTYPNLMTVEGIRGDETSPTNGETLAYVFTRMIAGPADNTVCWNDPRVARNASYAYQLAKPVCLFSPWQFLFWYDRPAAVEDTPELDFFNHLPTAWDDTRGIHGIIGDHAVIARRRGTTWFTGAMNADTPRTFDVPLTFLEPDRPYIAHLYSDDATLTTRTKVRVERRPVTRDTVLKMELPAKGGMAVRIEPAVAAEER